MLIAIALAVVGLAGIDRGSVADALTGADPGLLALAVVAYALGQTLSGAMWMRCQEAGGVGGIPLGTTLGLHWIARAACELLPASLGEGVRVALVRRHPVGRRACTWQVTGGLAGYKALDAMVTATVVLVIAIATPLPGPAASLRWTAVGFVAVAAALVLAWRYSGIRRLTRLVPARIAGTGRRLATGAGVLSDPRAAGGASLLGLGAALSRVVSLGALLAAFGISPAAAGLTFCVIVLAGAVPGAPGGAGTRELILVPALAMAHGVSGATAVAFSVAVQATALGTSLLVGILALGLVASRLGAAPVTAPVAEPAPIPQPAAL